MRSNMSLRAGGLAGALCLTGLASAAGPAQAQSAAAFTLEDGTLRYGQSAVARGALSRSLAGRRVALEFRAAGDAGPWRELAARSVGADGRYRVSGRVPRTGALRVSVAPPAGAATVAAAPSAERRIRVLARLGVSRKRLDVRAGRRVSTAGVVRPGVAGLRVALQVRRGRRWSTVDRDRTNARGGYALADRRRSAFSAPVRLRVSGAGAGVASTTRSLGRLNVYRTAYASWYGPGLYGNSLGCGGTLGTGTLGVAHKTLPCGTKVTLRRGSRSVRVAVIDRGPYVGGREYDLTAATARRIGFGGHGPVQVTR